MEQLQILLFLKTPKISKMLLHKTNLVLLLSVFIYLAIPFKLWSVNYYLTSSGAANAHLPASWNTNVNGGGFSSTGFDGNGDVFTIPAGISGAIAANWTFGGSGTQTLNILGTLTIPSAYVISVYQKNSGSTDIIVFSGGVVAMENTSSNQIVGVLGNANTDYNQMTFTVQSGASVNTKNANGVAGSGTQSIRNDQMTLSLSTGNNFEFSGASQVLGISLASVNNLTFSGSGTKTLYSALTTINGNFTTSGTVTTSAVAALNLNGNVNIGSGTSFNASGFTHLVGGDWTKAGTFTSTGTINFNGSTTQTISTSNFNQIAFTGSGTKNLTGTLSVNGNWSNTAMIDPGTSLVVFTGASAQSISQTGSGGFYDLQMNGSGAKSITNNLEVSNQLTLSSGILDIGIYHLKVGSFSGGSSTSYVKTSSTGRVKQDISLNSTKNFAVGYSAYNPIELTNNQETPLGEFNVRVSDSPITNANDNDKTVNRRWYVNLTAVGDVNITAKMTYNSGETGTSFNASNSPKMAMFNGQSWSYTNASNVLGTQITASGTLTDSEQFPDQFLSLGSDDAFNATKFNITIFPTNPTLGVSNSIISVYSVNQNNVNTNVNSSTDFSVSPTNTTISGTLSGTIPAGQYQVDLNSLTFTTATTDFLAYVSASRTAGEILATTVSANFSVIKGAIYELTSSGSFNSSNWRKSLNGGSTWSSVTMPVNDNVFNETDLITIPSGMTLDVDADVSLYSMIVEGVIDLKPGYTLTLNHPSGNLSGFDLHIHGTFKNSGGTFVNNDGTNGTTYPIEMHGGTYWHARDGGSIPYANWASLDTSPSTCKVTGIINTALSSGLDQNFENFEWNNSGQTVEQSLSDTIRIANNFTISAGTINTGSNLIIHGAMGTVSQTNGWVIGNFRCYVHNTSDHTLIIPIGDFTYKTPVSITFDGTTSGSGFLDVTTASAIPPVSSGLSQTNYVNRKWSVVSNGINFSSYSISLTYNSAEVIGTMSSPTMRRLSDNIWYNTGGSLSGTTYTATSQSTFSDFYIADADCSTRYVWFGSSDSDWNTATNWCSGFVPDRTKDVLIPGGIGRYPNVTNFASCKNLEIGSAAELNTGAGSIYLYGNISNDGSFICGDTLGMIGNAAQTISGSGTYEFNHFSIANTGAVNSSSNILVNGMLSLTTANPSATVGCLEMTSPAVLFLGPAALTSGNYDVNGTIRREHTFIPGTDYSFGNQYTTLNFAGTGTRPNWLEVKVAIGTSTDDVNSVLRRYYFKLDESGYTDLVTVKVKYLDSELNSNTESNLAFYDQHTATVFHEHGFSNRDNDNNWISLEGKTIGYLATTAGNKYYFLKNVSSLRNTWVGVNGDWSLAENWTFGHAPNSSTFISDDIYIPAGKSSYPSINADITVKSMEIADGAVFQANAQTITVTGATGAWIDGTGGFNYGTSTVSLASANADSIVQIKGNTTFNNLTLSANTNLQPFSNTVINIHNSISLSSGAKLDLLTNPNTFVYHTETDQTLLNPSDGVNSGFYNLYLNNASGIITFPSSLNVKANLTISGPIAHNNGTVTMNGSAEQLLNGSAKYTLYNLVVDNAAGVRVSALDSVSVASTLTINSGKLLSISSGSNLTAQSIVNNAGSAGLVLESASGQANASLIFSNTVANPVPATVQMYSKAYAATENAGVFSNYQWQYVGFPFEGLTKSNTVFTGSYLAQFNDASSSGWEVVPSSLTPFRGYSITQATAKTLIWSGNLINQDQVISIPSHYTDDTNTPFGGYHLLANSFSSAVNIADLVFSGTAGAIDYAIPTVYLFNTGQSSTSSTGTEGSAGQYWAIPQNQAGVGGLPSQISSLQGFFVQSGYSPVATSATLTIPYSATVRNTSPMKSPALKLPNELELSIDLIGEKSSDKIWLFRNPSCSNLFDPGWDGEKLPGSSDIVSMSVAGQDKDYQVFSSNVLNGTTISVSASNNEKLHLKFNFDEDNLISAMPEGLFLKDLVANQIFKIENTDTPYEFVSSSSQTVSRFEILTKENIVAANEELNADSGVKITPLYNELLIENNSLENYSYKLFDISGKLISQANCTKNSSVRLSGLQQSTVYLLKIWSENHLITRKFIL